ncbi:hydroxyisourate hydrolase [Stutzerimonas sp. Brlt_13]|jgi:5-hydroxyisourate hydrolase|uniref:hydroxyisourate hydrolase n=1 Tax=Stutzerimonas TaxID=2901164 RepID=UPI000F778708|nr:hydroxyisourate hydrolase [Stutzerimonas stutzeri]RRV81479.1 hydroxyisourate hydrolase [Stutzerimonas stutzeri]
MKALRSIAAGLMLSGLSGLTLAAGNPLSVHVLNLENGLPSPDVRVTLEQRQGDTWKSLNSGETNAQGRITALYPEGKALEKGTYRVTFKTGDWFATQKTSTFFPEVPVIFEADGSVEHYHIPLLLSPYGFSTYRGN